MERARLLIMPQNTPEWMRERRKRLGASSCSSAVGLGPAAPWHYFRYKTGRIVREDTPSGIRIMQRGHDLEPVAARAYNRLLKPTEPTRVVGLLVHPLVPWIHCSPDRVICNHETGAIEALVEIKCPAFGLPLRIKDQYMCQV